MKWMFTSAALSLTVGALVGLGAGTSARAQGAYMYSIAANDGYGLQECLGGGADCGEPEPLRSSVEPPEVERVSELAAISRAATSLAGWVRS